ncbi:esterase [Nannochloropsis oceanica]
MVVQAPISTPGAHSLTLVNSKTGNKVAGILSVKDPASSSLCVICHGLCSSKETGIIRTLGEDLDFNTHRFDFAGNGDSEGDFRYTGYDQEGLRSRGWNVACILGHSKGAHAVLRYSSTYGDVPKVFSLAARFDFSQQPASRFTPEQLQAMEKDGFFLWNVRGRDYKVTKEDFKERDSVDMVPLLERVKTTHPSVPPFLLLAHGEADETIPVKDVDSIAAILGPSFCRVVRIPGADHFYRRPEDAQAVVQAASRFLKEG